MVEKYGFKFLKVAIVVGEIDGDAILQQSQSAHVKATRKTRTANGNADLLPKARLGIHAWRKGQSVTQRHNSLICIIFVANDISAACGFVCRYLGFISGDAAGDNNRGVSSLFSGGGGNDGNEAARSRRAQNGR